MAVDKGTIFSIGKPVPGLVAKSNRDKGLSLPYPMLLESDKFRSFQTGLLDQGLDLLVHIKGQVIVPTCVLAG